MRLKQLVFFAASRLGVTARVRDSAWRRRRLPILCYHGISLADEHEWDPTLYLSAATFRRRLEWLARHRYQVLPLGDAIRRLYADTLPPRSVALTFDDGTTDFAEVAVPLLREFGMPATVYVATYYAAHRLPVFDVALAYLLWKGRASRADLSPLVPAARPMPVASVADRDEAWRVLTEWAAEQDLDVHGKDALLARVAATLRTDYALFRASGMLQIMTEESLRSLPADLVDVQLHTHRHRTPSNEESFRREIDDNRRALAAVRGEDRPTTQFCYPLGRWHSDFLPWLRREGVTGAVTCVPVLADRHADPLLLPRYVDADSQPLSAFEAWVSGFAALVPVSRRHSLEVARIRRVTNAPRELERAGRGAAATAGG